MEWNNSSLSLIFLSLAVLSHTGKETTAPESSDFFLD